MYSIHFILILPVKYQASVEMDPMPGTRFIDVNQFPLSFFTTPILKQPLHSRATSCMAISKSSLFSNGVSLNNIALLYSLHLVATVLSLFNWTFKPTDS